MSLTVKVSFLVGLVLGIVVVLSVAIFRETDSSYVPRVEGPIEEDIIGQPVSAPITEVLNISAAGAYTLDGSELHSLRADKRWPIASITKLMTAAVADKLYLSGEVNDYELIKITEEMVSTEGISGGLQVGEIFRADDLIKAMMLVSSNDAAAALAMHYGEEAFVDEMNKFAIQLGMIDTNLADPTGLSVQNLSTVEDLRRLAKFVFEEQPYIFSISRRQSDSIVDRAHGARKRLDNINALAGTDEFLGGKTGSTPEAEGNLISIFEVSGRTDPIIIIVLGTDDRFGETEIILMSL